MNSHPTLRSLSFIRDGLIGETVVDEIAHVDRCSFCQARIERLGSVAFTAQSQFDLHVPDEQRVDIDEIWDEPATGHVRRLTWDDALGLGAIRRVEKDHALVQLIVPDGYPLEGLSDSIIVRLSRNDVTLVVLTIAMWISNAVIDAHVGDVVQEVVPDEVVDAEIFGERLLALSIQNPDVDQDVVDSLQELAASLLSSNAWQTDVDVGAPVDAARWMDAGVGPGRSKELSRGAKPTPEESAALTAQGAAVVVSKALWDEILHELNSSRVKSRIRDRAAASGVSEAELRRELSDELRMPIAARTDDGQPLTIRGRLDELLR